MTSPPREEKKFLLAVIITKKNFKKICEDRPKKAARFSQEIHHLQSHANCQFAEP
jgi:hypothetical protein